MAMDKYRKTAKENKDLENFLSRVNEVESIMNGFANDDETVTKKADELIAKLERQEEAEKKKTGVNRTVINDTPGVTSGPQYTDPSTAGFMAAMEQDCQERMERRQKNEGKAERYKERGNEKFKIGLYEEAVNLYTKALETVRYWSTLYTNRAQALIKLEKYTEALLDCDWAMRAEENCLKAYVLRGKAYIGMKDYARAREAYDSALKVHPNKVNLINEYVTQLRLREEAESEEKFAREAFSLDAASGQTVPEVLKKLLADDQPQMYYIGGLVCIKSMISSAKDKILLRTEGAFYWWKNHPAISRCFSAAIRRLSKTESALCTSYLDLLLNACKDCETNEEEVVKQSKLLEIISNYVVEAREKDLKLAAVNLLNHLSLAERNQSHIISHCHVTGLTDTAFANSMTDPKLSEIYLQLLNNLTKNKKFKLKEFGTVADRLIENLSKLLIRIEADKAVLASVLMFLQKCDSTVTSHLVASTELWPACLNRLSMYRDSSVKESDSFTYDVVCTLLAFLSRLASPQSSTNTTALDSDTAERLTRECCHLVNKSDVTDDIKQRAQLLLSRLLPQYPTAATAACESGILPSLLGVIQTSDDAVTIKLSVQCLTACTQHYPASRKLLVDTPKGLGSIVKLLRHSDETVLGNAALCVSHCVGTVPAASKALTKTDVIKDLLLCARDKEKSTVQQNCAILIAKLATSDQRHLLRLRELHGLEILHTVLRHAPETS